MEHLNRLLQWDGQERRRDSRVEGVLYHLSAGPHLSVWLFTGLNVAISLMLRCIGCSMSIILAPSFSVTWKMYGVAKNATYFLVLIKTLELKTGIKTYFFHLHIYC